MEKFIINSDEMVISDPCYEIPTWCQEIVKVKKGTWFGGVKVDRESQRVKSLTIFHEDYLEKNPLIFKNDEKLLYDNVEPFVNCGVDSGQLGFFDLEFYRNDKMSENLVKYDFGKSFDINSGDSWYRSCCHVTLNDYWGSVGENGIVSQSGYGDGSYDIYGIKENDVYVCLGVLFI